MSVKTFFKLKPVVMMLVSTNNCTENFKNMIDKSFELKELEVDSKGNFERVIYVLISRIAILCHVNLTNR